MADTYFSKNEATKTLIKYFQSSHISETFIKAVVDEIPPADVVEKTEWDKLMNLVEAANNVMESAQKWISVKERLPEPRFSREWYLVALESGCVMTLAFERDENRWAETGSPVTHWMLLPEPPKEGGDEDG